MAEREITPSQTIGPFFALSLTPTKSGFAPHVGTGLTGGRGGGEPIHIEGRLTDGAGEPMSDALIEIWQADGEGRFRGDGVTSLPNTDFAGFGRAGCDHEGRFT